MITDIEVKEYAKHAGGHTGQLAATRAILEALDRQGRLLPDRYRTATFRAGGDGLVSNMVVKVDGPMDIFRFAINMLNWQTEFGAAARHVLVELRDHMTPERFDPMARSLLGDRYEKLADRFERYWHCRCCDEPIRVGAKYAPTSDAGAVCARCCRGIPEYASQLVKRTNPVPAKPDRLAGDREAPGPAPGRGPVRLDQVLRRVPEGQLRTHHGREDRPVGGVLPARQRRARAR